MEIDDNNLFEILKVGDSDSYSKAIKYIYRAYLPMIEKLVFKNSGSSHDSEDLFQEGIIVLLKKFSQNNFNITCTVKTYFYSICRNIWLQKLRKKKLELEFYESNDQIVDVENHYFNDDNLTERQERIKLLILKLGKSCKELITLFYFEENKMNELVEKLGYANADTAKTQKYKCLNRLRQMAKKDSVLNGLFQ